MRRRANYRMAIEERDELAGELGRAIRLLSRDGRSADQRRYYKVGLWDAHELHVEALIHARNDLSKARTVFDADKARRPRGRRR